ncbi:MAG: thioredoxin family protein [Campylobacter sp.]|nr:thioredoxin family protein [Campylobacter sp.]
MVNEIKFDEFKTLKDGVFSFGANWCRDCKFAKPLLESLSDEFEGVKFYEINIDENDDIRGELGIAHIPTILFLKDGKEICDRVVEPKNKDEIKKGVLDLLK